MFWNLKFTLLKWSKFHLTGFRKNWDLLFRENSLKKFQFSFILFIWWFLFKTQLSQFSIFLEKFGRKVYWPNSVIPIFNLFGKIWKESLLAYIWKFQIFISFMNWEKMESLAWSNIQMCELGKMLVIYGWIVKTVDVSIN